MNAYWQNRLMTGGVLLPGLSEINTVGSQEINGLPSKSVQSFTMGVKNRTKPVQPQEPYREVLWIN